MLMLFQGCKGKKFAATKAPKSKGSINDANNAAKTANRYKPDNL
mgnify:CR=1 FL=1